MSSPPAALAAPVADASGPLRGVTLYPTRVAQDRLIVHCVIPGEPVAKQRPRYSSKSRSFYTPGETQAREEAIGLLVRSQMRELFVDHRYAYGLRAIFFVKDGKKKDVDNMLKLVSDAMTGVVWKDDSQVHEVMAWRIEDAAKPRTEIAAYRLPVAAIREDRQCLICQRHFADEAPSAPRKRLYCSIRCSALAQRTRRACVCTNCGKTVDRKPVDLGRTKRTFCSRECITAYSTVKSACTRCGAPFTKPRSNAPRGKPYCSSACYHAARREELRKERGVRITITPREER